MFLHRQLLLALDSVHCMVRTAAKQAHTVRTHLTCACRCQRRSGQSWRARLRPLRPCDAAGDGRAGGGRAREGRWSDAHVTDSERVDGGMRMAPVSFSRALTIYVRRLVRQCGCRWTMRRSAGLLHDVDNELISTRLLCTFKIGLIIRQVHGTYLSSMHCTRFRCYIVLPSSPPMRPSQRLYSVS